MADCMAFPEDWREFLKDYSFKDEDKVYTNGSQLIPTFRVEQLIKHLESQKYGKGVRDAIKDVRNAPTVGGRVSVKDDEDLISRAALLEEFRSLCGPQTGNGWDNLGVRSLIMRQKSVDAEPMRHGRWIKMTGMLPPEYHGHYCCSECEWHAQGLRNSWNREEELLYCPNCGAKMNGGERTNETT